MSIHPLSESQDYDLSEFVGNSRLQLQTGCNGIKVFQQFWLIGAFWVFSTILMLFPRNHFFNITGRPVVLWLRFLVFETFCCVWQAGHAFCCVCGKFVVAELGFSRNTRCQRLSPTELGNRIGDWIHLVPSWDAVCSTIVLYCFVSWRFFRSAIGPESAGKNAQSRETVKT